MHYAGSLLTINAGLSVRPQPRHESGPARARSARARTEKSSAAWVRFTTWNVWSPRWASRTKLTADGRTMLRASTGGSNQGVSQRELPVHPGRDTDHDDRVFVGDRRLHEHRLGGRSQEEPATRSRERSRAPMSTHRGGSGGRAATRGSRSPTFTRLAVTHRMDGCRRAVSGETRSLPDARSAGIRDANGTADRRFC